ncbi:hypothetical protein F53441_6448 [Fusarium austroafricanum]|uniref:Cytochrome P450 monooxygenase n=1 Tax=Fusarium austroafricanum TaxID=2364996 RepID=A0A8H4NTD1_9HYPO|nr:hypothetical protein F53441_6448 [Fusarium austroafricanum]
MILAIQVVIVLVGLLLFKFYLRKNSHRSLPPGPKPLPILGNIRDLPSGKEPEYQHWLRFKDRHGLISHISVFGQSFVIIHDRHAIHEILDKASAKTSARPHMNFAGDMCGYSELLTLRQYDATFRQHRKLVHQQLGTKALAARFQNSQDVESHRLLFRVLNDPENLIQHFKTEASAIMLQMTYGYVVEPKSSDPLAVLIERMMQDASTAAAPLTWAVDLIPALRYLPEWFPGTSFHTAARKSHNILRNVIDIPYTFVQRQMAAGRQRLSYVSSLVEQHDRDFQGGKLDENTEKAIKYTAAAMYAGGADTTVTSITSFILAMLLFPAVQKKAQEEIEAVVGVDRLPQHKDRENLPYIDALIKETHRWLPIAPMGVPHVAAEHVDYKGLHIPKGALLLPAVWWFLHDDQVYSDPLSFDPDRYLGARDEPDPANEMFGYGRRICPGRYVADDSMFITISRLLATFHIGRAVDERGNEIIPKVDVSPGLVGRPLEFPYIIKPRNDACKQLIKSVETIHPWEEGDASRLPDDIT